MRLNRKRFYIYTPTMSVFFKHSPSRSPEQFWEDYAARHGEKILANGLGRYLAGWAEFDGGTPDEVSSTPPVFSWSRRANSRPLWGLLIVTSGGFRFHHFPQDGWLQALSRVSSGEAAPQEKTAFIPRDRLISVEYLTEKSWWKRFLYSSQPRVVIHYRSDGGGEAEFLAEADLKGLEVVAALKTLTGTDG
jgi:hypothetical protein